MHFLVEKLGYVDDFVVDVADLAATAKFIEQNRLCYAEVDAFEEANVANVLAAALSDYRQDAKTITIIEHCAEIGGEPPLRRGRVAKHDRSPLGVQAFAETAKIRFVWYWLAAGAPGRTELQGTRCGHPERDQY